MQDLHHQQYQPYSSRRALLFFKATAPMASSRFRGSGKSNVFFYTVDSNTLEHGCRMMYAGFASLFGLGLEDGHVPTFWLLL